MSPSAGHREFSQHSIKHEDGILGVHDRLSATQNVPLRFRKAQL
jgi:hypothetical protein